MGKGVFSNDLLSTISISFLRFWDLVVELLKSFIILILYQFVCVYVLGCQLSNRFDTADLRVWGTLLKCKKITDGLLWFRRKFR